MKELNKYTPIELLKMINDIKSRHDILKQEVINHTQEIDEIETKINEKIDELNTLEKNYVIIIEEMNNRNAIQ